MKESHRSSHRGCSIKKVCLKISQNSQENNCDRVSFSCEFCETFKNTFFTEHLQTTASEDKLVTIAQKFWKLDELFVKIRSILEGFFGFLKQVGSKIKFLSA